jgi:hypothetical protein
VCSGDRRFKQSPVTVRASCSCGSQIDQVCVAAISRACGLANAISAATCVLAVTSDHDAALPLLKSVTPPCRLLA